MLSVQKMCVAADTLRQRYRIRCRVAGCGRILHVDVEQLTGWQDVKGPTCMVCRNDLVSEQYAKAFWNNVGEAIIPPWEKGLAAIEWARHKKKEAQASVVDKKQFSATLPAGCAVSI